MTTSAEPVFRPSLAQIEHDLRRDPKAAWAAANQILERADPVGSEVRQARVLRAQAAFFLSRLDEALADLQIALPAAQQAGETKLEATIWATLGKVHGRSDRPAEGLSALQQARRLYEGLGDSIGLLEILQTTGNIHNSLGDTSLSTEAYADALALARQAQKQDSIARMLNNLATIEQRLERYEQARIYLREAASIFAQIGETAGVCLARFNTAEADRAEGRMEGLIECYQSVLEQERRLGNAFMMAACLRGLAETYAQRQEAVAAEAAWQEAIELLHGIRVPGYEARLRIDYARFLFHHGRPSEAQVQLEMASELDARAPSQETQVDWLEVTAKLTESRGDFAATVRHLRELRVKEAALFTEQARRRMEVLAVLHRVAESQREVEAARQHGEQLAAALAEAERERQSAVSAHRFKSDMLRMAAHDVRAPLNAVIGFLGLAREDLQALGTVDAEILSFMEDAESSAYRAVRTLARILDAALLDTGNLDLRADQFHPSAWVEEAVREARALAARKAQTITVIGTSTRLLTADRVLLAEVLQNYLGNAIKFGPRDQQITVEILEWPASCEIRVCDTGPGLTADDLGKMFQPFYRGSARPTADEDSTGLGLALVRGIVEAHGGTVGAHSPGPGRGSSFWLRLPWDRSTAKS